MHTQTHTHTVHEQAIMEDSTFKANKAVGPWSCGAAIKQESTVPMQVRGRVVLQDNLSERDGGGLCVSSRDASVSGSVACAQQLQAHPFMIEVRASCIWLLFESYNAFCVCVCMPQLRVVYKYSKKHIC